MKIVSDFISAVQTELARNTRYRPEWLTDYRYIFGPEKCCHVKTTEMLFKVARRLEGVVAVDGERALVREKPRWKPDVVLRDAEDNPILIVEYESINSSDVRVVEKDFAGYRRWRDAGFGTAPLLVLTTLPAGPTPHYRLLYTGPQYYNWEFQGQRDAARADPREFWYRYYRRQLKRRIAKLPVFFANFNGKQLEAMTL